MIDPFFFDRLLHAFTTANASPLNQAATHAANAQTVRPSPEEAPMARALREAEAVAEAVWPSERTKQMGVNQAGDRDRGE